MTVTCDLCGSEADHHYSKSGEYIDFCDSCEWRFRSWIDQTAIAGVSDS